MEAPGIPGFFNKMSRNGGAWYSWIFQQNVEKWRCLVFLDFSIKCREMEAPGVPGFFKEKSIQNPTISIPKKPHKIIEKKNSINHWH
jgi:hypothetical protein